MAGEQRAGAAVLGREARFGEASAAFAWPCADRSECKDEALQTAVRSGRAPAEAGSDNLAGRPE